MNALRCDLVGDTVGKQRQKGQALQTKSRQKGQAVQTVKSRRGRWVAPETGRQQRGWHWTQLPAEELHADPHFSEAVGGCSLEAALRNEMER